MEDKLYFTREQAVTSAAAAANRIIRHNRIVRDMLPAALDKCRVDWTIQEDAIYVQSVEEAELTQVRILLRADGWFCEADAVAATGDMPEVWRAYKQIGWTSHPEPVVETYQIIIARLQSASEMLAESKGMVTVFQDGLWNKAGGQEVFSDDN